MSDWKDLLNSSPVSPPPTIHDQLRALVERDLHPGIARVAGKVGALHIASALVSLAICPQFGIGPFGGDGGLMSVLMEKGWLICAIGCGAAFMTGTGILSALILSPDEKRVLARHQGWVFSGLAGFSWALFMLLMGLWGKTGHSGHHEVLELSPTAFSASWNLVWTVAATLSALAAFHLARSVSNTRFLLRNP